MALAFSPISSPGATRDLFVDLAGVLEDDELLASASVTSAAPEVLEVNNVFINDEVVTFAEQEIAIGKGVYLSVETKKESQARVPLKITFAGDSGTSDNYELIMPIVVQLCH